MAKLKLTYTIEEIIDVNVEDYKLTRQELKELAEMELDKNIPDDVTDCNFEWIKKPKAKGFQSQPPDDFWIDTKFGEIAHTSCFIVTKELEIPKDFDAREIGSEWRDPNTYAELRSCVEQLFTENYRSKPLHLGYFHGKFLWLKKLGVEVRGDGNETIGFVLQNNKLVALLMPVHIVSQRFTENLFQFHLEPKQ